jgi:hypothetical protein
MLTASGMKHFKGATGHFNQRPFDFADRSDLQVFLDLLELLKEYQVWGWNIIFTLPVTNVSSGVVTSNHNLFNEYALLIPLDLVRSQGMTYRATPTKGAQD